jgi:hypothetical protein
LLLLLLWRGQIDAPASLLAPIRMGTSADLKASFLVQLSLICVRPSLICV